MTTEAVPEFVVPPEIQRYLDEAQERSDRVRAAYRNERVAFGAHPRQVMDVYDAEPSTARAPVFVFVHGGGFLTGSPENFAYVGEPVLRRGAVFVSTSYRLLPETKVPDAVEDLALALRWIYENIAEHGGDPDAIYVSGHSAGAMLAAYVGLRSGWQSEHGVPDDIVKGLVLVSGVYTNHHAGDQLNAESPYFVENLCEAIECTPPHTIVATAERDLPACQPEAEALIAALRARGASCEFVDALSDRDHFFVGHELADDDGRIFAPTRVMLGLE